MKRTPTAAGLLVSMPGPVREFGAYFGILGASLASFAQFFRPPVRSVLYRQIYFTGLEPLLKMAMVSLFMGAAVITQITVLFGLNTEILGKVLLWTVLRELGPLLTAMLVIARSGVAVTAELAAMKVAGEIRLIELMGINPFNYLIVPRVAGMILSLMLLTVYLQAAAVFGGLLLCDPLLDVPVQKTLTSLVASATLGDIFLSLTKSALFGGVIGAIVCYQGVSVTGAITQIPQATIKAVMRSFLAVFIL
ncbi:MAG: ABC transporter permease, partial [Nitrospinae bacterium]|nr:ABC transporter permease [Nitrospinota bacterium]